MKHHRRQFLHLTAIAAALPKLACYAWAEVYPAKPVNMIVTFPAGSGPDIIGRLAGQWLSERLGQQFVIENKPGFGGNIGTEYVVNSLADGYTILMPVSTNAVNPTLYPNLSFNFMRDIAPIAGIGKTPFVVVVPASFPANTLLEFIAYAKANPGKINMASGGIGSSPHVCGELLQTMTGIKLVHVPYRTNYIPDLLAGQVLKT
jgi:tripartite-type tricarboxylate transporter receptor subunit TctC